MTPLLAAGFEKRFTGGPTVRAAFTQPAEGFSITVLFGPSGCGKTTILRCLAGLEQPQSGRITFGEQTWFDSTTGVCLPPQRRGVGFLFQEYALFPHLTVARNVGYGLSALRPSARRAAVERMLRLMGMEDLGGRYPRELSGGQQQRVALARALACEPRLLLLDEPLSALDTPTREPLRQELRRVLEELGVPAVLVTHDRTEAIALADQLIVLDAGVVRQAGPVHEVFTRPADLTVARIIGVESVIPGRVISAEQGLATIAVSGGVRLLAVAPDVIPGDVYACVRGEDVTLDRTDPGPTSARNRLAGRVVSILSEGALVRVTLDCGFPLTALVTRPARDDLALKEGDAITAVIKASAVHVFPRHERA